MRWFFSRRSACVISNVSSRVPDFTRRPHRVRIALVGPFYPQRSGISHYNTQLAAELTKHHDTALYGFRRQYPGFLFPGKTDVDAESHFKIDGGAARLERVLDALNPFTWHSAAARIAEASPALVILHWWSVYWAPLYLALVPVIRKKTGAKILFIVHHAVDHDSRGFSRGVVKKVLRLGDYFIAHSESCLQKLFPLLPAGSRAKKVLMPVYDIFNRGALSREEARTKLDLSGSVILFFGLVRKYKGLDVLLRALSLVPRRETLTLLVAGEFWESQRRFRAWIARYGLGDRVRLAGGFLPNEDVELYFKAADLAVFPYLDGAGSGALRVAMSFALPVIASRVGDFPEIIEEGKNGYLTDPGDAAGLAEKIELYFKLFLKFN